MSQFFNTEHANESFRNARKNYNSDKERIAAIKALIKNGEPVSNEAILWVCERAELGMLIEESSWYDHG